MNSICGLGKEVASVRSLSFSSFAAYNSDIKKNMYSFEIYPHLTHLSSANAFHNIKVLSEDGILDENRGHAAASHGLGKLPY